MRHGEMKVLRHILEEVEVKLSNSKAGDPENVSNGTLQKKPGGKASIETTRERQMKRQQEDGDEEGKKMRVGKRTKM